MPHEAIDQIVRESTEKGYSVWEILERFLAIPSGLKREQAIASRIPLNDPVGLSRTSL